MLQTSIRTLRTRMLITLSMFRRFCLVDSHAEARKHPQSEKIFSLNAAKKFQKRKRNAKKVCRPKQTNFHFVPVKSF